MHILTRHAYHHYTTSQPTRVSRRFLEDGTRVRVAKRSGAIIPKPEFKRENIRRAGACVRALRGGMVLFVGMCLSVGVYGGFGIVFW